MLKYLHNSQQQLTALTERKSDLKDLPFIYLSLFVFSFIGFGIGFFFVGVCWLVDRSLVFLCGWLRFFACFSFGFGFLNIPGNI